MKINFSGGNRVALCLAAVLLLSGCNSTRSGAEAGGVSFGGTRSTVTFAYADTISWDAVYDVVVVGFGGSGAITAITAANEGAKVLLTEKAPEGE
ncbi:MAG: FAD-binding protein, partial [Spirochaetaceae bacterium]|nr:FAD-binding protein [Spirochaetaceae bacterium]